MIGAREKIENGVNVQSRGIVADGELITVGFDHLCHAASLSHHGIIADVHVIASKNRSATFMSPAKVKRHKCRGT